MIIRDKSKEPFGIIEIYPFISGELTSQNAWSARIEIFPESLKDGYPLEGKRIRYQSNCYSREEWNQLSVAMEKAFEIEAATK